jgi:hypothetical protein
MTSIAFGYDTEITLRQEREDKKKYLNRNISIVEKLIRIHKKQPATFFLLGKLLEMDQRLKILKDSGMDIQSHLYSHSLVKKVPGLDRTVLSLKEIDNEINKSKKLIRDNFGKGAIGLRLPYGYFQGLKGNSSILKILKDNQINYVSSFLRNKNNINFVPWKIDNKFVQPSFYLNKILEIPVQGYLDTELKDADFVDYYLKQLEFAHKHNLHYCTCFHPIRLAEIDPKLEIIKNLIRYAKENNIKILNYSDIWEVYSHGLHILQNSKR